MIDKSKYNKEYNLNLFDHDDEMFISIIARDIKEVIMKSRRIAGFKKAVKVIHCDSKSYHAIIDPHRKIKIIFYREVNQ